MDRGVEIAIGFLALGLLILCVVGLMRGFFLLAEAKRDREVLSGQGPAITTMARFFVYANYIHITKFCVGFVMSASLGLIALGSPLGLPVSGKVYVFCVATGLVFVLAVSLLEMEARARRAVKEYRKEGSKRGHIDGDE